MLVAVEPGKDPSLAGKVLRKTGRKNYRLGQLSDFDTSKAGSWYGAF
jgi:hypothetical protein